MHSFTRAVSRAALLAATTSVLVAQQPKPAGLRLPKLLADGMVVQRGKPVAVWGWADPGAEVSVSFRGGDASAKSDASGRWAVRLPAGDAGGPFGLSVRSGANRIDLHDVLVGDVWVASGQSNMEWPLAQASGGAHEIAAAHDSLLRQFKIPISWSDTAQADVAGGEWARADSAHAGRFSAVAYYFARDLRKTLGVPIGIINSTWGGSNIETWMTLGAQHLTDSTLRAIHRAEDARMDAIRDSLSKLLGELPTKDVGMMADRAVWADPALDDMSWRSIPVPAYWESAGYSGMDGIGWYRVAIDLSAQEASAGVTLNMNAIDDDDITWMNGTEVGRTQGYSLKRSYRVPASALHAGRNVLVVRVSDYGGGGGINDGVSLAFADGTTRALAGQWKFKVGEAWFRPDGQRTNKIPSITYNSMIHPLLPLPIAGVIWYQGESNSNNDAQAVAYRDQFRMMIESWRGAWTDGRTAFPFFWVQLPNFGTPDTVPPVHAAWALQRESMDAALTLPNTGRAIAIDAGDGGILHPTTKEIVGQRLARVALAQVYKRNVAALGPTYRSHTVRGDTVIVEFANAAGLHTKAGDANVGGFSIAGNDYQFAWATGKIVGNRVYVWSSRVSKPAAVRYAWANDPDRANLYNGDDLPAAPFRTDHFQEPKTWTAAEDHRQMMQQLGITALRPGPSGNEQDANHANYDEAKANPFPKLPDVLTLKSGKRVTTPQLWAERRAEIVEDFEREVFGRVPKTMPKVTWTVTATDTGTVGGRHVIGKQLTGHVDNSAYPLISVDIPVTLVLPADAKGPVPVMIMFRGGALAQAVGRPAPPPPPGGRGGFVIPPPPPGSDAQATDQLIIDGWGFAFLNPTSVQADNGAGLTRGIIGLVNKGQPRRPDDWGALRAWGWGASRTLDYLATDRAVDAKHVGIEGVSRYGKAALVAMAFDQRFATVLIGSSGEGGAKLHRRNWGEAVESLTGSGEYHWMAGNFLKYGASAASFGSKNAGDIPVDAHELLALCAPRLTFVSYGVPEKGDAKWLDHQGSYMAAVAAQPVFRLLGARGLGVSDDYTKEKMPAVNVGLLDGQLAWRQHDGGHTDAPNWKYFLSWADHFFNRRYTPAPPIPVPATATQAGTPPAAPPQQEVIRAMPRTDSNSMLAHRQLLAKRTQGKIDVYFIGNSIVRRWGATDYPDFLANWRQNFFGWNAGDFGWGADRIENMLWRLENGELDGVNPKVIVIEAGTNNVGQWPGGPAKVATISQGIRTLIDLARSKAPNATIILTGITPRNDNRADTLAVVPEINRINENIARFADGRTIRYVNINDKWADASGRLHPGMTVDGLHPTVRGYQIWADALKPILTELLGPPAATDQAPPPTGDPSARRP